ncbi:MAG: cyclase family protein [Phycisphaeraceae bacterium]|nr:cyclase family protein [Phycisphaeraceae bacterium]
MIFDLSPLIDDRLKVWPGDTPPGRQLLCDIASGSNITLSTLRATVHLGSHVDGPNHYSAAAPGVEAWPLERFWGPCHVVDAPVARAAGGARVRIADLRTPVAAIHHPRVLLKTGTFPDFRDFNEDFAGLEPALIDALAARGVQLIGLDTPSVDVFTSKDLPAHAACLRHSIAILEGLVLRDVMPGEYELCAMPLKLANFDASPVRAALRPLPRGA